MGKCSQNVKYLDSTGPLIISSGSHQLLVQNGSGPLPNGPAAGPMALNVAANSRSTVVYYGYGPFSSGATQLTDDTIADNSNAKLRIGDFASTVQGLDVYVVPFGSSPSGTPALSGLGQASQTPAYQLLAPGNYDIYFTATGMPTQILYHTGSLTLAAKQNRSVYFFSVCPTTGNSCNPDLTYTALALADLN